MAYDLNEPEVVSRLEKLGKRLEDHHRRQRRPRRAGLGRDAGGGAARRLGRRGQRQAPAHAQPAAQQDHRRRRPEGAGGRLRLDQLQLARLLRAVQQRRRAAGREARSTRSSRRSRTTGQRHADGTSATPTSAELERPRPRRASTPRSRSRRTRRRTPCSTTIADDIGEQHNLVACSTRSHSSTRRPGPIRDAIKKVTEERRRSSSTASPTGRSAASTPASRTAMSRRSIPPQLREERPGAVQARSRPAAAAPACTTSSS